MKFVERLVNQKIQALRDELYGYYIMPLASRVGQFEGLLQCAKGVHATPQIRQDKSACSRCGEILGVIVPPKAKVMHGRSRFWGWRHETH